MRKYLTRLIWYKDRLCSISSTWLIALTLGCVLGLAALGSGFYQFLDDLAFLLLDGDVKTASIFFGLVFLTSIGLWLLSCCLGALGRRLLLYLRGL